MSDKKELSYGYILELYMRGLCEKRIDISSNACDADVLVLITGGFHEMSLLIPMWLLM